MLSVGLNAVLPVVFHELIHLELGVNRRGWDFLPNLFSSTPNLKVLVFAKGLLMPSIMSRSGFDNFHGDPPESPPTCLEQQLKKEIKIHNFVGKPCECLLIRYLLKHGKVEFITPNGKT